MQRDPRDVPRVSTGMRKSMLELERKARWLRRSENLPLQAVRSPRKSRSDYSPEPAVGPRPISAIVKDYKQALEKLEDIEAELADWLTVPAAGHSPQKAGQPQGATIPPIAPAPPAEPLPEGVFPSPRPDPLDDVQPPPQETLQEIRLEQELEVDTVH